MTQEGGAKHSLGVKGHSAAKLHSWASNKCLGNNILCYDVINTNT